MLFNLTIKLVLCSNFKTL